MQAFGGPVLLHAGDAEDLISSASAAADMARSYEVLTALNVGGLGSLRIFRPPPTAAFAPRDTTLPAYREAAEAMAARGFAPVERRAGGQLAIYDTHALVIDLVAPHDDPRQHVIERFRVFSAAIAAALSGFAVDARVGQVDGEYCPGDYSVNAGGAVKLAGVAQRIGRCGYHLGAVISVTPSPGALAAVADAYRILGFPFAPDTFGALAELAGSADHARVRAALLGTLSPLLPISPCG
jgi:octanoyl-[GcvH]:protein N-octanoyltransferase